jgi:integrase
MSPSKYASKRFPNLYKFPDSKNWVFRKYSASKGKEFRFSTGESKSEAKANAIGLQAYHEWLGLLESGKETIYFEEYAREQLDKKLALPDTEFSKSSKRSYKNSITHLIKAFGHLRLDQLDENQWEAYYSLELTKKKQKFFNRRKILIEITRRALREGIIQRLPEFKNPDPKASAGQYLSDETVLAILEKAQPTTRMLIEILWRQGARPGEVIQYRWDMIRWDEATYGAIHIPAEITKTRRARTIPLQSVVSERLKQWMLHQEKLAKRKGRALSPWIFPSWRNATLPMTEYKNGWKTACKGAKVKAVPYDLRRTFITNQAKLGRPILYVAKYTDTSIKMVEEIYAKVNLEVFGEIID